MHTSTYFKYGPARTLAFLLLASAGTYGQIDPVFATLRSASVVTDAPAGGTTREAGPAPTLLRGFPKGWYELHRVLPRVETRLVVAPRWG
jgi:hypothetical protein